MTFIEPYAGMDVYGDDGQLVGRVKQGHLEAGPQAADYLVIDRPRVRDILVPRSILEVSGTHLELPFGTSVADSAPQVSLHGQAMTTDEELLLDSFYSLWTKRAAEAGTASGWSANRDEQEGVEMSEKAKRVTDKAKAAADEVVQKAKAQGAELLERSRAKEAELRAKADQQAVLLREKAKKDAAELRARAKHQAAELLAKASQEAAALRAKARDEAKAHGPKAKDRVA